MTIKPEPKLKKTTSDLIFDLVGGILFLSSLVYLAIHWGSLPDEIPAHFNGAGEVDRYGSRGELLILPIIGTFLWGLMEVLERNPQTHNYPIRLNEENKERLYQQSRTLLNQVKNICLLLFAYLTFQIIRVALGEAESLGKWTIGILIAATVLPIVFHYFKLRKIK